ncbi:acyl-CoA dehydrogenase family protein [Streptomyces sp. NPDC001056]
MSTSVSSRPYASTAARGLALLDRTVAHVHRRTRFGVPVGSFQAVRHRLADAKTEECLDLVLAEAIR